jgi:hypothetical protein
VGESGNQLGGEGHQSKGSCPVMRAGAGLHGDNGVRVCLNLLGQLIMMARA